jgi:hypothetical protein
MMQSGGFDRQCFQEDWRFSRLDVSSSIGGASAAHSRRLSEDSEEIPSPPFRHLKKWDCCLVSVPSAGHERGESIYSLAIIYLRRPDKVSETIALDTHSPASALVISSLLARWATVAERINNTSLPDLVPVRDLFCVFQVSGE